MNGKKVEMILPTPQEDAIINAQIAADSDDFEWDDECFANSLTTDELLAQHPELRQLAQFANGRQC